MAYIFLENGDLESAIISQFLNERGAEQPTDILETIEKKKIALIKTKLKGRFDVDAIFDAEADDRNFYILDILIKLVLYDFIKRNAARKVPKDYSDDFNMAMKTLEKIKSGNEVPDGLPSIKDTEGESVKRIIHGNNRNPNFYI
jgi:hypothetical protein